MNPGYLIDVSRGEGRIDIARIIKLNNDNTIDVCFLSPIRRNTFSYTDDIETIPQEAVCGFYDTSDMTSFGVYHQINENVFEMIDYESDSDSDFIPSLTSSSEYSGDELEDE